RIREYAGEDAELLAIVAELERGSERFSAQPLGAIDLKRAFFDNYVGMSARGPEGRARRAPKA
ncbi:MAG TPA: hypothetical protein VMY88_00675, partial [Acidimicrobiales bacterium]|nr:hypothetical protein [Acidimicrobiales bacterium]